MSNGYTNVQCIMTLLAIQSCAGMSEQGVVVINSSCPSGLITPAKCVNCGRGRVLW